MFTMNMLDKGMIHVRVGWSGTVQDFITLLRIASDLNHKLFISEIFSVIFSI